MENYQIVYGCICLASGICWIGLSFMINTNNFRSDIIFKVVPFFMGLLNLFVSGKLFNVI